MNLLSIADIRERLGRGRYHLSDHAFRRMVEQSVSEAMIRQAGTAAEMIEDYPNDKYSPSCLLLGFTREGRPLHIQVSRVDQPGVKIVTVYFPNPSLWDNWRRRKAR